MDNLQQLSKKTLKSKQSSIITSPLISKSFSLNINLKIYLSEFLDVIDVIEFAYTNKFNLKIKNSYIEKLERLKINCGQNSNEIENFNSRIFENNPTLFKSLKNLSCTNYKIKHKNFRFELNNLQEISFDNCTYGGHNFEEIFEMNSSLKNIQKIEIKNSNQFQIGFGIFIYFNKLPIEKLTHITLKNINFSYYEQNSLDALFLTKNLEGLDLSENIIENDGLEILSRVEQLKNLKILNLEKCGIGLKKEIIEKIISGNNNLELLNISNNFDFTRWKDSNKIQWDEISTLLLLRNNSMSGLNKLKIIYDNLKLPPQRERNIMRMLFSRSGIINTLSSFQSSLKDSQFTNSGDKLGKCKGSKHNGAILPQIIYNSTSNIEFTKNMLIEILKIENKIRLSNKAKDLFDLNKLTGPSVHLRLDREMIKSALEKYGFNPDEDDSLKAYHLATTKFIHDEEVRNSVVWMKYDKCKVGKYTVDDHLNFDGIKLHELNGNVCLLKDLLCNTRTNLIVSGSLS